MCYSKEVSLFASIVIFLNSLILFIKNRSEDIASISVKYLTTGYLFIGLHQLFEFLAIFTQSQIVYKTGLLFSISSMIYNLKSLEKLASRHLGSKVFVFIISILAIYLYVFKDMKFNEEQFYVRGEDHFLWGSLWMIFFLYWNFLYFNYFFKLKESPLRKFVIQTPFYALNISFFLASMYSYSGGLIRKYFNNPESSITRLCSGIFTNFEIVFDAPSIWCSFATIQGFFLYYLLTNRSEITQISINEISLIKPRCFPLLIIAIICVIVIFITLPLFSALSYKMILK